MPGVDNEGIDYRSAVPLHVIPTAASNHQDKAQISTLQAVEKILAEAVADLYKDFNAFDILREGTNDQVRDDFIRQVAGKQVAYDILAPVLESVRGTIQVVNGNFKR